MRTLEKIEKLSCNIKNSELACPKEKRDFLVYRANGLCPCSLETLEDGIALNFDTDGMEPARQIFKKPLADKLRFLVNAAELESLHNDYSFSLVPSNLLTDINLRAWVLQRDLNCNESDFLDKYKALIGAVLSGKYSYDNYINGGNDLYKKIKVLKEISQLETVSEVRAYLAECYEKELEKTKRTRKVVPKRNVIFSRIMLPILTLGLLAISFFAVMAYFFEIPYQEKVITASAAYISGDFIAAQNTLRDLEPSDMTHETRHFLSRSYVITQPLTDAEIHNILIGLTPMTDGALFDYWIYLGRLNFDGALEIARRYGDTELLLFAYLKQEAIVQADLTMPGDEKVALLNYLEREIARLINERTVSEEDGE
jgi:type VII secretion protein EssB